MVWEIRKSLKSLSKFSNCSLKFSQVFKIFQTTLIPKNLQYHKTKQKIFININQISQKNSKKNQFKILVFILLESQNKICFSFHSYLNFLVLTLNVTVSLNQIVEVSQSWLSSSTFYFILFFCFVLSSQINYWKLYLLFFYYIFFFCDLWQEHFPEQRSLLVIFFP